VYIHGGGFSMGSSFFYLEFLLAFLHLLKQSGLRNPAIISVEYSLVPDAIFPTQLIQALAAYKYALSFTHGDASKICVAGDSAGGTLVMSLLLHLRTHAVLMKPALAVLISPWVTILEDNHADTASDFLSVYTLHQYGHQYLGATSPRSHLMHVASPGLERASMVWSEAAPTHGFIVSWGTEEVMACDISGWVGRLKKESSVTVRTIEDQGKIHAWPVVALYLGDNLDRRLEDLKVLAKNVVEVFRPGKV
jgi:acetyl esterase/lipase